MLELNELQLGPYKLPLNRRTLVMGIINVTPDSFSGDGLGDNLEAAFRQAKLMAQEGADILDIGGESTRPGAEDVSPEEEIRRVLPLIRRLTSPGGVQIPLSVDTRRGQVAEAALFAGANLVNDITGLRDDPEIAQVAAKYGAGLILMHIKGTPRNMQQNPTYHDLLGEVKEHLADGLQKALAAGIVHDKVWVDPGIGFGKTIDHNLELLRRLKELQSLGCAIMVGTSRKSFIGRILARELGGEPPAAPDRVWGTAATLAVSIANGASIVRVHDVAEAVQVCRIADAIVREAD